MFFTVATDKVRARRMPIRSPLTRVTWALFIATSVPVPIAMPTSALAKAGASDRLEDTISYAHIYRAVRDVMEGEPRNLLEAAAQSVADRILAEFPVNSVAIRVKKPHPPIRGSVIENATVEIFRRRQD